MREHEKEDPRVTGLRKVMKERRIPTAAALAELLSKIEGQPVNHTVVSGWLRTGRGPRLIRHQHAIDALLDGSHQTEEVEEAFTMKSPDQRRVQRIAGAVSMLLPHLVWLVQHSEKEVRRDFREELTPERELFIRLSRALTNEEVRKAMLEETPNFWENR